ncbi:MAG: NUDIX hydrolase [Candidatus Nealsonbacteria bacterium]|nr:NUDIX hydrolase [Candidatus Nealsonbacteria bacterium]
METEKTKIVDGNVCGVMALILDQHNNLLLLQRIDNKKWEPVKGGILEGENDKEAAIREVKEETNLDVRPIRKVADEVSDEIITARGKIKIKGTIWVCEIVGKNQDVILAEEHSSYKWVSLDLVEKIKEDIYPPIANYMIQKIKESLF